MVSRYKWSNQHGKRSRFDYVRDAVCTLVWSETLAVGLRMGPWLPMLSSCSNHCKHGNQPCVPPFMCKWWFVILLMCFKQEMIKVDRLDPNSQVFKDLEMQLEKDRQRRSTSKRNQSHIDQVEVIRLEKAESEGVVQHACWSTELAIKVKFNLFILHVLTWTLPLLFSH